MHDPLEGMTSTGAITTGASKDRIPALFEPVLDAAVALVPDRVSLYVYGSVATGMARPESDVDLLSVGLLPTDAAEIGRELSERFSYLCRGVEVAAAQAGGFAGRTDEAYGGRVFLRHYCVHLAGPDLHSGLPDFPADRQAARGFNGDIGLHAQRWQEELDGGADPAQLGRRLARKTLLAVAGLVSVHDQTWTTDRWAAAARWAQIEPAVGDQLRLLHGWSSDDLSADGPSVAMALDGVVPHIVASFEASIGLWDC